jgi:hypothetical protein
VPVSSYAYGDDERLWTGKCGLFYKEASGSYRDTGKTVKGKANILVTLTGILDSISSVIFSLFSTTTPLINLHIQ